MLKDHQYLIVNFIFQTPAFELKLLLSLLLYLSVFGCTAQLAEKNKNTTISALDYASQFAEHKRTGNQKKMGEAILKARYRWLYEEACYPATVKGSDSPGVFMGAFLFATNWDLSTLESQPRLYAEMLAGMLDWQVAPQSGEYHPGYPHRKASQSVCNLRAKILQKKYSKTITMMYAMMSNAEYRELVDRIAAYEKLSATEKIAQEKEYLRAIQRKSELEGEYDPE